MRNTVEPRLTNTLLKRTPLSSERFWPVPNNFLVKSYLKTPLWANNLALPVQRTAVCPPKVFVCEVFTCYDHCQVANRMHLNCVCSCYQALKYATLVTYLDLWDKTNHTKTKACCLTDSRGENNTEAAGKWPAATSKESLLVFVTPGLLSLSQTVDQS